MTEWSDQQKAIFAWFKTPRENERVLLVQARAGSGKTSSIIEAVRHAPERRPLLVAFNKVIADELQSRIPRHKAEAKTLHALGYRAITDAIPGVKVDQHTRRRLILHAAGAQPGKGSAPLFELITKVRELAPFAMKPDQVREVALEWDLLPDEPDEIERFVQDALRGVNYAADAAALAVTKVIDFSDQIFLPLRCDWARPFYDLVVVDEAQDMTGPQLMLAQRVLRRVGRLVVIGDSRQVLYAWNGVDLDGLDKLKDKLGAVELPLTTTFRCPARVVAEAKKLVPDYEAAPGAPDGIVRRVKYEGVLDAKPGDFILSRTNAPLAKLCLRFLVEGIPAAIRGRDFAATVWKFIGEREYTSLAQLVTGVRAKAARDTKRIQLGIEAGRLSERAGDRLSMQVLDTQALIEAIAVEAHGVDDFTKKLNTLFSDDVGAQVVLSTVHRAKGLEADRVWILEHSFELKRHKPDPREEANVRYVALTRAKRELVLVDGEPE